MKNINVQYDMDENDLDIILREIAQDNNKKPSLQYIFENYKQLLSVFKPSTIKKVLDNIPEAYEHAPNEGEESEKKKDEFEDEPHDIESDPESMKEEGNFANAYDKIMDQLNEAHVPEGDDEGRMIQYQLKNMQARINELLEMIQPNDQFEGWVQSKITLADDYILAVSDYLKQHYAEYHSDEKQIVAVNPEEMEESVVEEKKNSRCTKVTQKAHSTRSGKKWMKCVRQGGKLKRIHWGQAGVRVTGKSGNTKRKKSFKKRHKCGSAKLGTPRAMACRDWT